MELKNIKVKGQLGLNLTFKKRNIILGENRTGKSTLMNLILYSLGSRVDNFIDEIKSGLCQQVELDIKCKNGNSYRLVRSLPKSEVISIFQLDDKDRLLEETMEMLDLQDFSDFLLNQEGYQSQKISYGKNQNASLRYYFLLRAVFVDQDTPASAVLANIGGENSGFLNNQKLIKKAIIEEIIGKDNYHIQKIRFELQSLIKDRQNIQAKLNIIKEIVDRQVTANKGMERNIDKVKRELVKLETEKQDLKETNAKQLTKFTIINEKNNEKEILRLKLEKDEFISNIRALKLEILDLTNLISELQTELDDIKKKFVARQVLTLIPVDKCPICLSTHSYNNEEKKCSICDKDINEKNEQTFKYKKMLEDTYKETSVLIEELKMELSEEEKKVKEIDNQIGKKNTEYIERIEELKNPIDEIIDSIKVRYEDIIHKEELYKHLLESLKYEFELKSQKGELDKEISVIRDTLSDLERTNSISDMEKVEIWEKTFSLMLKEIFGDVVNIEIDENYMPIIDGSNLGSLSSASLKVAARIAYLLSLFYLKDQIDINHIGFIFFDSPKDKDLDTKKYRRFLKLLSENESGQVFITGSIEEKYLYEDFFEEEEFLIELNPNYKLLSKSEH